MSLVQIPYQTPSYIATSADIVGGKISGLSIVGAMVYITDTEEWYVVQPDLSLVEFVLSGVDIASIAAGGNIIGKVGIDQTTPGTTDSVSLSTGQGAGATIGTTSGAAVITDSNGTVQQYLRGLVKILADVYVSASHWLKVQLQPSENFIGGVGGRWGVKTFSFTRPANTTAYTAKDAVNVILLATDATNANPIVVTTPTHGLADGDYVTISGVVGNTAANGSFYVKVTGYSSTTFALYSDKALTTGVAGNGAWSSGGSVCRLFRLKGILRTAGGSGMVLKVRLFTNLSTFTDQFRVHFYNAPVAVILDNSPYTILDTNKDKRLGYIDCPAFSTEGSGSDSAYSLVAPNSQSAYNNGLYVFNGETPSDTDLWVRIEDMSAGTPASAQTFYCEVSITQD